MRLSFVALLAVLTAACSAGDPNTVARYQETSITAEELREELARGIYTDWKHDPEQRLHLALRELVLQTWSGAEPLNADEARSLEYSHRLQLTAQCVGRRLNESLAARGDINTTAREFFSQHPGEFDAPERFRLQLIFLPKNQPGSAELAQRLVEGVSADPDGFAELAKLHSQSETAQNGGTTNLIDGPTVHPTLRQAVIGHLDGAPFLMELDRGWYVIRVLEYIEAINATFEMARPHILRAVQADLERELLVEIVSRDNVRSLALDIDPVLYLLPVVDGDAELCSQDGDVIRAHDLVPVTTEEGTISGPALRSAVDTVQNLYFLADALECRQVDPGVGPTRAATAGLRLPRMLPSFLVTSHRDELVGFYDLHRGALMHPPSYVVDLAIFPYRGNDQFADLESYRPVMDDLAGETPPNHSTLDAAGAILLERIELTEAQLAAYDTDLVIGLRKMAPGLYSEDVTSDPAQAFLMVRLHERHAPRPLDTDRPADLSLIARSYVVAEPDTAIDLVYEALTSGPFKIDMDVARRVAAPYFDAAGAN